jgi:4-aminobutyrate aminotransferase-like enzyme/Ser/Thr protein kinase RdoA (MazF antagonist)
LGARERKERVLSHTFDFFQAAELPVPDVSADDAAQITLQHFGLSATAVPLGSQQDANFLLSDAAGAKLGVLKIANPAFSRTEIEAQDSATAFLADRAPGVRTSRSVSAIADVPDGAGGVFYARILDFLDGGTMSGPDYVSPQRWAALGTLAGRASVALADFDHPGVERVLQWDLRHADRTIEMLLPYVTDTARGHRIASATEEAWRTVAALGADLPIQVIHGDLTDDNVVCTRDNARMPDGVIDFGDLVRSWAIGELAVAVSCVLRHAGGEPAAALPLIAAFDRQRPLQAAEITALWPLVVLRAATLVVSGIHQVSIDAENDYATGALDLEWQIFERATEVPSDVMAALISDLLGHRATAPTLPVAAALFPELDAETVHRVDLAVPSPDLDGGRWLHTDCERQIAEAALDAGAPGVATVYGSPRLTRSVALHSESPATVPTGIDVWLADTTDLQAPWFGLVSAVTDDELLFAGEPGTLVVRGPLVPAAGLSAGIAVDAGAPLGQVRPGRLWLQVTSAPDTPAFVRPEYAPGWLAGTRDPAPLLGLPPARAEEDPAATIARRERSLAAVQEHYYRTPPRIERGWREHLLDIDGRCYVDMVNNVAAIGHGRIEVADAVARQWRLLNTNSRFNYRAVADFSERLATTLPAPLDTVFLVNSGSEAVDLALRLAMATTGRRDIVAVREAYHGWTYATDAVSTSVADNPNALDTRPDWVHTVASPNSYRGDHRDAPGRYAEEAVGMIEDLVQRGQPPAAFICEPFYGNAGGIALPPGYLPAVYAAVRGCGGLAIADEVQVGYGRLGHWFWGFQGQDVVPDIVTVAKAMGNGHPLGAVITSRAIADAYRTQGYFFSSAGGSPVSCVVGLTVLDVIERDGLQHNALTVGEHLTSRLAELAHRHALIGAVHGSGLYLGVELVRDRQTLEPAVAETAAICERMRELGVIVQPTGDRMNVLKMKPPMCLSTTSADFFVDMLDRVLSTGW